MHHSSLMRVGIAPMSPWSYMYVYYWRTNDNALHISAECKGRKGVLVAGELSHQPIRGSGAHPWRGTYITLTPCVCVQEQLLNTLSHARSMYGLSSL